MHALLQQQLAKARARTGLIDVDRLTLLVSEAYEEADRDRRRTDRSIALMIEELDQFNARLERLIAERTAELEQREHELRAQNVRFDAAVSNMTQGLIMFDAEARMVICNQRYLEMYNLTPEMAAPGRTLGELLRARAATGTFQGDPDHYTDALMNTIARGVPTTNAHELDDGRTIAVVTRPMSLGGWVATHEDITEQRNAEKRIAHMARHDALTDLPNRVLLREQLAEAAERVRRGGRLAVLYIDLDQFKNCNDTLGHPVGDMLLQEVAARLRSALRETSFVARLGGDEFAVVETAIRMPNDAAVLARRLGDAIREPYEIDGHVVIVDSSIGISLAPDDGADPNRLMKNADLALNRAKAEGRGTYRFFEPEMDERMQARRALELALRNALAAGEMEIHYQPIVNLDGNRISAFEALIRWHHPERGLVPPTEFVPVAEEIGLIVPLGEWVIREACCHAALWPDHVGVAVNLSPTQLMNPNLITVIVNALAAAKLSPRRLQIEITEDVLLRNTRDTVAMLHRLRDLGVRISMDDFGTGYSSLSYLSSFPFDKIKIDGSFIKGLGDRPESAAIVQAVTGLARSLDMTTTAEGVETEEQLEQVRALGCTEMQGYLYSQAMRFEETLLLFPGRADPIDEPAPEPASAVA